jgi:alpha-L-rhamnosidase
LKFNLLPENLRDAASKFLVADIKSRGNHLSTGFLGTIYVNDVLTQSGSTDVAYDLLLQETYPSWIYPVKMGATTIWERWDGQKTDSTFQDAGMNSFNHYAYGAIGDWMYRVSAGIEAAKPGYKQIIIQPSLSKKLDYSKASFESLYGTIASGWERKNGKITVKVKIPANTNAEILLPVDNLSKVTENGLPVVTGEGKSLIMTTDVKKSTLLIRGSGEYTFEFTE